jgi:hypothetical protein
MISSAENESNILYKCKTCDMVITTEQNLKNNENTYKRIFDQQIKTNKKKDMILFVKLISSQDHETTNSVYNINSDGKILCICCSYYLGYTKSQKEKYLIGFVYSENIISESIITSNKIREEEIPVYSKFIIENLVQLKNFNIIYEALHSYTKDLKSELIPLESGVENLENKSKDIEKQIEQTEKKLKDFFKLNTY